jgi:cytosine/creatinine deaminase
VRSWIIKERTRFRSLAGAQIIPRPRRSSLPSHQLREGPQLARHVGAHDPEHHLGRTLRFHRGKVLAQLACRTRERELLRGSHIDHGGIVLVQHDAVAKVHRQMADGYRQPFDALPPGTAIGQDVDALAPVFVGHVVAQGDGRTGCRTHRRRSRFSLARRDMTQVLDYHAMLQVAIEEAREGLTEGGIPIGAALFDRQGKLLGRGHNRRVQEGDPSAHAETDAFRKAGRQRTYRETIMVTTLAPCWYCSGLVRQFRIGAVIVGESINLSGGIDWLRKNGVEVIDLNSLDCMRMLADYIAANQQVWNEDIGEE